MTPVARARRRLLETERYLRPLPAAGEAGCAALVYPNCYAVAMSSLAVHSLWGLLLADGWQTDRAFLDPQPGRSLALDLPLRDFDLLAVTCSYELDYLALPALLEAGGVPALREERGPDYPLVIAGGPAVTANPQPLSEWCDLQFIGEVEPVWADLSAALRRAPREREAALAAAAALPGVYRSDRPLAAPVRRQVLREVDAYPTASLLVTPHAELSDRFLVEAGRGCPRTCRFCLARQLYHPFRPRSLEGLLRTARPGLAVTPRVGLVGAALSEHPQLLPLCEALVAEGAQVSTSSLRLDTLTPRLLELLAASGARSLTLAPEAGTEELRRALGKPFAHEQILGALEAAQAAGLHAVKLYFLIGAPGETSADRQAIADLVAAALARAPGLRLEVTLSPLVPKPHTPWELLTMPSVGETRRRLQEAQRALQRLGLRVTVGSAREALVQTALSRGGAELSGPLVAASRRGGSWAALQTACAEAGLRLEDYLAPPADPPWRVVTMNGCSPAGAGADS